MIHQLIKNYKKLIQNYKKTQLLQIGKSGGFLGRLLGPLLETGLSFNSKCT